MKATWKAPCPFCDEMIVGEATGSEDTHDDPLNAMRTWVAKFRTHLMLREYVPNPCLEVTRHLPDLKPGDILFPSPMQQKLFYAEHPIAGPNRERCSVQGCSRCFCSLDKEECEGLHVAHGKKPGEVLVVWRSQ